MGSSQRTVVDDIRGRILDGSLAPGVRLPTRAEMVRSYGVSSVTVQRALDRLVADGFVIARGRRGTFVAERPPHLHRIGLVLGQPDHIGNGMWAAITHEAEALARERGDLEFAIFYDAANHDSDDNRALVAAVEARSLAGLFIATHPSRFVGTPVLDGPDLPRVAISERPFVRGMGAVSTAGDADEVALKVLGERGCQRLAVLYPEGCIRWAQGLQPRAAQRFESPTRWHQMLPRGDLGWAPNVIAALFHGPAEQRPDGLAVLDDNLLEPVLAALDASGLHPGRDLEVAGHANFPFVVPSPHPVHHIGYDGRQLLEAGLDFILARRRGRRGAARVQVPAVRAEDIRRPLRDFRLWQPPAGVSGSG